MRKGDRCAIHGCREWRVAGDMCSAHWRRWLESGLTDRTPVPRYTERPSGCWEWNGTLDPRGYGHDGPRRAHRLIYEEYCGPIPPGLVAHHLCHNHACVNPEHILLMNNGEHSNFHNLRHSDAMDRR